MAEPNAGPLFEMFVEGRSLVAVPSLAIAADGARLATAGAPMWIATFGLRANL